jgi:hypothetical protein
MAGKKKSSSSRTVVLAYARNLHAALGDMIGMDVTWLPISRSLYQPRQLKQYRTLRSQEWQESKTEDGQVRHRSDAPDTVADEHDVWSTWLYDCAGSPQPLVIIAPPGTGKTALLEQEALNAVAAILNPQNKFFSEHPLVPVLLSLSRFGDVPLEDLIVKAAGTYGLPTEVTRSYLRSGQLLVLVDGLDEVPAARHRLLGELSRLSTYVVVTSRPGNGAEILAQRPEACWEMLDLSEAQSQHIAENYLMTAADSADGTRSVTDVRSSPLQQLLSRPLYLLAWCQSRRRGVSGGQSMSELARLVFDMAIERRNLFPEDRAADPYAADRYGSVRRRFTHWVGRVGAYFASRDFHPSKLIDPEGLDLVRAGGTADRLLHAALAAGLLHKVDEHYYLPKVPLVEFCIGSYLADDALDHPDAPKVLIDCFRRWIWLPALHDVLDFAFDALWRSGPVGERWAEELLSWAVRTAQNDATREHGDGQGPDDLLTPFAVTVMRWYERRPRASRVETADENEAGGCGTAIKDLPAAIKRVVFKTGFRASQRLFAPLRGSHLLPAVVESLIAQIQISATNFPADAAARLLHGDDAPTLVLQWYRQYLRDHGPTRGNWASAAITAAGCVKPSSAEELLESWVPKYPDGIDHWDYVIEAVARRLPEERAAECVRRWLPRVEEYVRWWHAICEAAGRVSAEEAIVLAEELLDVASEGAIFALVGRFSDAAACEWAKRWSARLFQESDRDAIDFASAIVEAAARRLRPDDALALFRSILSELARRDIHALRYACARIMTAAAECLHSDVVPELVDELVPTYTIFPPTFADHLAYEVTRSVASSVAPSHAAHHVCRWLHRFAAAATELERHAWSSAVIGAVSRLREIDVRSVIDLASHLHPQSTDEGVQSTLQFIVDLAMTRAAGFDGATCANYLLDPANDALADAAVFHVSPTGTILLKRPSSQDQAVTAENFYAVPRSAAGNDPPLRLGPTLAHASDAIKLALLDIESELEHPDALALLATLAASPHRDASTRKDWLSRKEWFAAAHVNPKRGREEMLLDILLRRQFIDTFEEPNAGRKSPTIRSCITAAGLAFLARRRHRAKA